jgi:hypothetical protein
VRTLLESSRLNQAAREMNAYNISILGLGETRWNGFGDLELQTHEMFLYSGQEIKIDRHQDGVGFLLPENAKHHVLDWQPVSSRIIKARNIIIIQVCTPTEDAELETKEAFYSQLTATIKDIKKKDVSIVMNAKVGSENLHLERIMGRHGLGVKNENGELFIDFCTQNGLVIGGTMFVHKRIHKITWESPDGVTKNQIDHISISNKWKKSLLNIRSYCGADIDSDHHLVMAEVKMKVARVKHNHDSNTRKMDY